jgi:hypothetical protein
MEFLKTDMTAPVVLILFYFLPTFVAYRREHNNALAIFMLDLFLGWTFVGWVVALTWSCTKDVARGTP